MDKVFVGSKLILNFFVPISFPKTLLEFDEIDHLC